MLDKTKNGVIRKRNWPFKGYIVEPADGVFVEAELTIMDPNDGVTRIPCTACIRERNGKLVVKLPAALAYIISKVNEVAEMRGPRYQHAKRQAHKVTKFSERKPKASTKKIVRQNLKRGDIVHAPSSGDDHNTKALHTIIEQPLDGPVISKAEQARRAMRRGSNN